MRTRGVLAVLLAWAVLGVVALAPWSGQALGQISSPRDRAPVRGLVPIEGTAQDPQFQKYEVHFGPEPNPGEQWSPIEGSPFIVPVVQGRLGLWDTTIIPDGIYSLRLRVVRLDGNYDEYFVRGILVVNTRPTETPTPRHTPTPARPTDTPAPTSTVVIAVPTVLTATPRPTETPPPTVPPTETPPPPELPFGISSVGEAALWGGGLVLAVFVGVGVLFALKDTIAYLIRRLTGRGSEDAGV